MAANYYVGTATLDLTQSDMDIVRNWFCNNIVMITTLTPTNNAVPVWFVSASTIPGGVAASSVVYASLMAEAFSASNTPIDQGTI